MDYKGTGLSSRNPRRSLPPPRPEVIVPGSWVVAVEWTRVDAFWRQNAQDGLDADNGVIGGSSVIPWFLNQATRYSEVPLLSFIWRVIVVLVTKFCQLFRDYMDYSPPSSSVHGISQARILEWVAIYFSRGSSQPKDQTCISFISKWILYH